jgi:hypothetical protein
VHDYVSVVVRLIGHSTDGCHVDDHPVVRHGLHGMFAGTPEFDVVGEASNGVEAVRLAEYARSGCDPDATGYLLNDAPRGSCFARITAGSGAHQGNSKPQTLGYRWIGECSMPQTNMRQTPRGRPIRIRDHHQSTPSWVKSRRRAYRLVDSLADAAKHAIRQLVPRPRETNRAL